MGQVIPRCEASGLASKAYDRAIREKGNKEEIDFLLIQEDGGK